VAIEILNLVATWLMKRILGYDPLFVYRMPLLVYAIYRMILEMLFLIFLFVILGFTPWLVLLVGIFYLFGVFRHSLRLNRILIEGEKGGRGFVR